MPKNLIHRGVRADESFTVFYHQFHGKGFALPHARLDTLREPFAMLVRLARPIDFAAIDERPVDLAILLLSPANGGNQHLATLAALSRPLRDAGFVQKLRSAPDATAVHRLLKGG